MVGVDVPVGTTVLRSLVESDVPVGTTVRASSVTANAPVGTTVVDVFGIRLDVPVGSTVRGVAVAVSAPIGSTVRPFAGTGIHRSRLRDPNTLTVGTGPLQPGPPDPPPVGVPAASFTFTATDLTVTFTDTSTHGPTDWLWNFGDGSTSPVQNPTRTFPATGLYSVTLTAVNPEGASVPATRAISVSETTPPPPPGGTSFLGGAFWTTALDPSAPLASTSSNFVARLAYQATMGKTSTPVRSSYDPPASTITNGSNTPPPFGSSFALPIYRMPTGTTRIPVYAVRQKTGLQTVLDAGVPLPDPALLPGGTIPPSGSDGAVIILDPATGELWELWQLATATDYLTKTNPNAVIPTGYDWACTQAAKMTNRNTHVGIWTAPPSWGVAASGLSKSGGMLTADDFYGDSIGHPLGLSLPITGGDQTTTPKEPSKVLPATRYDRMTFIPGGAAGQPAAEHLRVPEGSRFRLPPASWSDSTIDTYAAAHGLPTASRFGTTVSQLVKILRCLRDRGAIITDSAGVVAFSAENPKTFGTPYNPYALADAPVWGNFGQQIPWTSLVQVAAPTADVSVPGAG